MNKLKKTIIGLIAAILIATPILFLAPKGVDAATRVKSYFRKSGTFVATHLRSTSNRTKIDNWSTKGNYNPYTGKKGYKVIR